MASFVSGYENPELIDAWYRWWYHNINGERREDR